jgi:protein gp37
MKKHYDLSWNPIRGCSPEGAGVGCEHCTGVTFAKRIEEQKRSLILQNNGDKLATWTGKIQFDPLTLYEPMRHKKPTTFMVGTLGDLLHPEVNFHELAAVFGMMAVCSRHRFLLCTKFPNQLANFYNWLNEFEQHDRSLECARDLLQQEAKHHPDGESGPIHLLIGPEPKAPWPPQNLWIGTSASTQVAADWRWNVLSVVPAARRFMVFEPLIERISMFNWESVPDWVLIGGELGPGARPCNVDWIRSLIVSGKSQHYVMSVGNNAVRGAGERVFIKSRTGSNMHEWPQEIQVQDIPWEDP